MNFINWKFRIILVVIILIAALQNCGKKEPQVVLAKVGDNVITADEFRYNYEFGLPHLKQGKNPKESYLNYMIKEELLA
ncbi:hypothetical protein GF337_12305, partial [candidate division KSB1 bacterium]|nr:hypothetical protein [candidate division KSB1 bacterium]